MRIWSELVEDARWSPSPHNIQGWLVRPVDAVRAELFAHPERLLPETDPGGRFGTVGLGMFVESLSIAAADRGLALDVDLNGRRLAEALEAPFASLSLRSGRTDEPLGVDLLRARRTSRLPYDGRQVDDSLLRELEQLAGTAGHRLRYSSDPSLVADILALNEDTLFFDMTDPAARNEVGGLLRFSDREARARSDGFSPAALGFPGWLLRLFFRSHRVLDAPVARVVVRRLYRRTMRGTRTIAWLQGPFEETHGWFVAGRLLQRLWLTMTARDVVLHPFGSMVTNASANARASGLLELAPSDGTFWLVMRLGHSEQPPRSYRLERERLLVP